MSTTDTPSGRSFDEPCRDSAAPLLSSRMIENEVPASGFEAPMPHFIGVLRGKEFAGVVSRRQPPA